MSANIETHLVENRLFKPPKTFSKRAYITSFAEYEELYRKSIKNPGRFWGEKAAELLVWQQKWKNVLEWKVPFAKWFIGGKLTRFASLQMY
jgi:acetyl-CoA synthetase